MLASIGWYPLQAWLSSYLHNCIVLGIQNLFSPLPALWINLNYDELWLIWPVCVNITCFIGLVPLDFLSEMTDSQSSWENTRAKDALYVAPHASRNITSLSSLHTTAINMLFFTERDSERLSISLSAVACRPPSPALWNSVDRSHLTDISGLCPDISVSTCYALEKKCSFALTVGRWPKWEKYSLKIWLGGALYGSWNNWPIDSKFWKLILSFRLCSPTSCGEKEERLLLIWNRKRKYFQCKQDCVCILKSSCFYLKKCQLLIHAELRDTFPILHLSMKHKSKFCNKI